MLKFTSLIIFSSFLLSVSGFKSTYSINKHLVSNGDSDTVAVINLVKDIDSNLKKYKSLKKSIYGKKAEADASMITNLAEIMIQYYYNKNKLVKIKVDFTGSQEDMSSYYYCEAGKLIYLEKEEKIYEPSKFNSGSKIVKIVSNRFFMKDDHILKYIEKGGAIRWNIVGGVDLKMKGQEIDNDFKTYLKYQK